MFLPYCRLLILPLSKCVSCQHILQSLLQHTPTLCWSVSDTRVYLLETHTQTGSERGGLIAKCVTFIVLSVFQFRQHRYLTYPRWRCISTITFTVVTVPRLQNYADSSEGRHFPLVSLPTTHCPGSSNCISMLMMMYLGSICSKYRALRLLCLAVTSALRPWPHRGLFDPQCLLLPMAMPWQIVDSSAVNLTVYLTGATEADTNLLVD